MYIPKSFSKEVYVPYVNMYLLFSQMEHEQCVSKILDLQDYKGLKVETHLRF